ncbi:hypothetical protein C5167_047261 [Papaver somniferum]|uniref:Glutaredoxin domain-containing protein n=1 Tax=Papaver somniferum TaxID=3469 RepID=A0A4Y7LHL9_PAPSO|nr:hypothetical protein C5167_047261 [Papaver somniferum]
MSSTSMASFTFSSTTTATITSHCSSSLFSTISPKNTPYLCFHSSINHRSTSFPLVSSSKFTTTTITTKRRPLRALTIVSAVKKISESELISVSDESEDLRSKVPSASGVYAVHDNNSDLQFIGISRNIYASIISHRKSVPELCSAVKVSINICIEAITRPRDIVLKVLNQTILIIVCDDTDEVGVVDEPDRESLTQAWKSWMEEHIAATGKIPPGNESGNSTWVKKTQKKPDLRLTPGRHVQLTVPLENLIDQLVKENKVVAFIKGSRSAPLCGFSQKVVGILEGAGVDYETIDVLDDEHNFGLREKLKSYSNWPTFPQIFVNGELVGGCDILTSMQENGELASLFKK